jgi:hypothetical protein
MIDQRLFDAVLANALDMLRLSATEKAKVVARLIAMQEELAKQLATRTLAKLIKLSLKTVVQNANSYVQQVYGEIQASLD